MSEYNYFLPGFWTHCLLKVKKPGTINHSKLIMHPPSLPEIPLSVLGVSSHRFFRALEVAPPWPGVAWPGVSRPGVAAPAGVWLGVGSQIFEPGVAPGVSLPFARPGVSSHRRDGVCPGVYPRQNRKYQYLILYSKRLLVVLKYSKKLLTLKTISTNNVFCRQLMSTGSLPLLDPNWTIF